MIALIALLACSPSPPDWRQQLAEWKHPDPIPNFTLIDAQGHTFTWNERQANHYLFVTFAYRGCGVAHACPQTMQKVQVLQEAAKSKNKNLHLLTLTIDPKNDKDQSLKDWSTEVGADPKWWTIATGDEELLTKGLPSLFNIYSLPDGPDIDHTVKAALLDPKGKLIEQWTDNSFTSEKVLTLVP